MLALANTTEIDSVNIMLATIGESPISTLAADQTMVEVAMARAMLREVTTQVQEEGWNFNSEINWTLTPDSSGFLYLPSGCIQLTVSDANSNPNVLVTARGNQVYDRVNHTYVFTSSLIVNMIVLLTFDLIPESARHYITIRAARVFQNRVIGSETLAGFTEKDEMRARASLKKLDADTGGYNILSGSWSVARVLAR